MFLDIGAGIFISIFVSVVFNQPLTAPWVFAGALAGLSPDADYIWHLLRGGNSKDSQRHRELFHYPLLFTPAGTILLSFINVPLAVTFALGSLSHFVHDSIGIGWGVQWLYPFTDHHYSFVYLYQPKHKERLPRKLVYLWKHAEIDELAARYGDEEWIRNIYFKWHPYAIVEFAVFVVSLIVLFYRFTSV